MELETIQECDGGVTAAQGFVAGGLYCGIRKVKKDIALVRSIKPALTAGVFTLNKVVAAPLLVDKVQLQKSNLCSAIVVNSGNANACTGEQGMKDAWTMVDMTANALHLPREQVLVSSTGVIGQYLPIEKVTEGILELSTKLSTDGNKDAAEAIMTTDIFSKECAVRFTCGSSVIKMGGMAKGSGMIAPNMAANSHSFNCISVDGDMSTNDMVLVLANGLAKNEEIRQNTPAFQQFLTALEYVLIKLAKMIVRDGEGATKFVEIVVQGARSEEEAVQAARSVANSNLVKTALHGADANWGRILAAVGYSGIEFNPANISISFNNLLVLKPNYEIVLDEEKAKEALSQKDITILINLYQGSAEARFWTCDLTKEYVNINASYRS
jgi:glutamate N-acetyltransferase/amino-acid N-acetyltransferase